MSSGSKDEDGEEPTGEAAANAAVRRILVESYRDLLGFLQRRLGGESEAEEVLQGFMLRAIERAKDLRDVRSARGWLSRLLATAIVDHQRRAIARRRREVMMSTDDIEVFAVEPDAETDKAVCYCLYKLLPTLKPEHAEMIWRIDLLSEPRGRVAASLGTSVNTITVRLHRGRQALKKRFEDTCVTCVEHGFLNCGCDEAPPASRTHERQRAGTPESKEIA